MKKTGLRNKVEEYLKKPYEIHLILDPTGGFFVEVAELQGCFSQGETVEEAMAMIREAMELWIETALARGAQIPEPFAEERFSGKFVVRMPKSLHRRLVEQARAEGVSLNALLNVLLASALAEHHGRTEEQETISAQAPAKARR
jgi:antitoxin HicB